MSSSITRQVIHQVSTGDREAFRILFNAYYSRVWHFADKVLNDSLYADEVAQLVFLGIWQKRKTLNPDLNFENFLYVLSRHAVIDFIRMNRRATMTVGLDAVDVRGGEDTDTDRLAEYHLVQKQIEKLVSTMPEQRRKVFVMSRRDGLSNDEISERLGISKRTVERHINLALNFLRSEMKNFCFILAIISGLT